MEEHIHYLHNHSKNENVESVHIYSEWEREQMPIKGYKFPLNINPFLTYEYTQTHTHKMEMELWILHSFIHTKYTIQ